MSSTATQAARIYAGVSGKGTAEIEFIFITAHVGNFADGIQPGGEEVRGVTQPQADGIGFWRGVVASGKPFLEIRITHAAKFPARL